MDSKLWQIPIPKIPVSELTKISDQLLLRIDTIAKQSKVLFAISFSAEDMVLLDYAVTVNQPWMFVTLDTGRLPVETLQFIQLVQKEYQIKIISIPPDQESTIAFVSNHGENGFYKGIEQKNQCCHARKVLPLSNIKTQVQAWVTGQRRLQSTTRADIQFEELESGSLIKFNPLYDWSEELVWAVCHWKQIPIHPLYRLGYPSIGCAPCTRAVQSGDDVRAGRWWWLSSQQKECGLHKNITINRTSID
ncbi:MAG: phosphoadenylyl-sulfate reductase [Methylacidiphilales bacterium]|nr:phosphoadenylyl-sulfate reductase [Candidatus Methylacidiphilales bacterium]